MRTFIVAVVEPDGLITLGSPGSSFAAETSTVTDAESPCAAAIGTVAAMLGLTLDEGVSVVSLSAAANVAAAGLLEGPVSVAVAMRPEPPMFAHLSPGRPIVPARTSKNCFTGIATPSSAALSLNGARPGDAKNGPSFEVVR